MLRRTLQLILFFFLTSIAYAYDVNNFTYQHLGFKDGTVSQRVYSLTTSSDGAVWWTTKRGVDRYNGAKIIPYRLGNKETYASFADRKIHFASYSESTMQDSLFVFDNCGKVFRYNKTQNRFDLRNDLDKVFKKDILIEDILIIPSGIVIANQDGLFLLPNGKTNPVALLQNMYCNAIIPMKKHNGSLFNDYILIATDKGLLLATIDKNGNFKVSKNIYPGYVDSGFFDEDTNSLWIGTLDNGVKIMRWGTDVWTNVENVPHNPVRQITPYNNTVLIGVDGFGVYQCSRRIGSESQPQAQILLNANDGRYGVLHGNGIYDILIDRWDNIIVGTYSGGIDIARPVGSTTAIFQHAANSKQCISNDHVNCVAQSDPSHLLMGTDNGLSIFDSQTGLWNNLATGIVVLDICKKPDGGLLLATYGNGVCEIDAEGKAHTVYSKSGGQLKDDHVYSIKYDTHGNLWIGVLYGKIAKKTESGFKYFDIDRVQCMSLLHDGRIAVGTEKGLFFINPVTDEIQKINYSVKGSGVVNKFILDTYEDNDRQLWIATDGGGVYIYNINTGICSQITRENGLPSNSVSSITKDKTGRIWFGTEKGLAFINPKNPEKVFDANYCYGIRTEYIRGAACNLSNGHLLLGTVEGARIIDPQHIQEINYKAPLTLLRIVAEDVDSTKIEAFNKDVEKMLNEGVLKLSYSQRTFDLYFESINMRNHYDIAYQYKIGDGEWSEPTEAEYIRFVNLEPGSHKLYIRCVSKTSGVVLDEKHLEIIISEPWWNSWWMWIIYISLIVAAFYGAWKLYDLQARYNKIIRDRVALPIPSQAVDNDDTPSTITDETERNSDSTPSSPNDDQTEISSAFVNKATNIVLDNLSDGDFTIDNLCREIGMSRTLFYVKLKSYTGKSPQDFVRMIRLEKAVSLLKQGNSVSEVAAQTGFDNPKYFSIVFKKYFGSSPSKYNLKH